MSSAGPPRPGGQPRSYRAAVALAARGRPVPVCPEPGRHGEGQRPPSAPVPEIRSLPPGGSPCPMPASSDPDPDPGPVPGAHRPFAVAAARSTPSSAPARGRWSRSRSRSRSLRSLSRNCHADRPLAGVHRGPPAHGVPRKVTQTPELRRPPRSIPSGTGLWPARCRRPWKLL